MRKNQKGFTIIETCLVLLVIGVACFAVWSVMNRKDAQAPADSTQEEGSESVASHFPTAQSDDGIRYPLPDGWVYSWSPFEAKSMTSYGNFLLSPSYETDGEDAGQLFIKSGALIRFGDTEWPQITPSTNIMGARNIIETSEGSYLDKSTIEVIRANNVEAIRYNSGHTTDGVTYLFRTDTGRWLEMSFSVSSATSGYGQYHANEHHQEFLKILDQFVAIN